MAFKAQLRDGGKDLSNRSTSAPREFTKEYEVTTGSGVQSAPGSSLNTENQLQSDSFSNILTAPTFSPAASSIDPSNSMKTVDFQSSNASTLLNSNSMANYDNIANTRQQIISPKVRLPRD